MRDFMVRLAGFLGRRRRWVLAAWVAIVACCAADRLAADRSPDRGRLRRPRQRSRRRSATRSRMTSATRPARIAVLLQAGEDAEPAARAAAVGAGAPRRRRPREVTLPPAAARRGELALQRTGTAMLPLHSEKSSDRQIDSATDLREDARSRHRRQRRDHLPRRAADDLGRHAGALQGRPVESRGGRLPDRRDHPARRLRLARRRRAAAGARLRQRDRHRGADLLPLAADRDLGLRHQHGLDDRDRGGDRLLALHPRPLPRGARRAAATRTPRGRRRSPPQAWRWPSPASP